VERLAQALFAVHPLMYPQSWPDDDPDDIGSDPTEDATAIAAEYARLASEESVRVTPSDRHLRGEPPAERERVMENLVRRWLERDDVREGVSDWLTNVYGDDLPPIRDLYDRIAMDRPLAAGREGD
jgi:hypothetical protein